MTTHSVPMLGRRAVRERPLRHCWWWFWFVVCLTVVAGCADTSRPVSPGTASIEPPATPGVQVASDSPTPSFDVPQGTAACAADVIVAGTSATEWQPLLACDAEAAGSSEPPVITIDIGRSVYVSAPGVPLLSLTSTSADVVTIHGWEIVGVHRGRAVITASEVFCDGHPPDPAAPCVLLAVDVR